MLSNEHTVDWKVKNSLTGDVGFVKDQFDLERDTSKKLKEENEYSKIADYSQFKDALKTFLYDLRKIKEKSCIKVVLLIDEAQVIHILFLNLVYS